MYTLCFFLSNEIGITTYSPHHRHYRCYFMPLLRLNDSGYYLVSSVKSYLTFQWCPWLLSSCPWWRWAWVFLLSADSTRTTSTRRDPLYPEKDLQMMNGPTIIRRVESGLLNFNEDLRPTNSNNLHRRRLYKIISRICIIILTEARERGLMLLWLCCIRWWIGNGARTGMTRNSTNNEELSVYVSIWERICSLVTTLNSVNMLAAINVFSNVDPTIRY